MSDAVQLGLIAAIPATITAITGILIVLNKIKDLHRDVDGRMTEMLELTRLAATAKGNLEGRAELKVEDASKK